MGLGHVPDNGGDAGAAHAHQHLLHPEGEGAVLRLPPQDQDLLLDENRVHVVVQLPLSIDTALVAALCLPDHGRVSIRVLVAAVGETEARRKVNSGSAEGKAGTGGGGGGGRKSIG